MQISSKPDLQKKLEKMKHEMTERLQRNRELSPEFEDLEGLLFGPQNDIETRRLLNAINEDFKKTMNNNS
jgi:hypothetical protein